MFDIDTKQILDEVCDIYGPESICMCTVYRWINAFKPGKLSVVYNTRLGGLKTKTTVIIAAVKSLLEQDARLSVEVKAGSIDLSKGSTQMIPKQHLHMGKNCSR